ncbi:hypothetical protein AB4Y32_39160 [Paraburkholderia phymatum]|uniref:Uncharacterized protein n=1 Tax=Paraburkholderia phymatum TaxID=148447 RepID=A0ACC6UDG2_9BURK
MDTTTKYIGRGLQSTVNVTDAPNLPLKVGYRRGGGHVFLPFVLVATSVGDEPTRFPLSVRWPTLIDKESAARSARHLRVSIICLTKDAMRSI